MSEKRITNQMPYRVPYDFNYETCERTCAVLQIYSNSMLPDEISKRLKIEPTRSNQKGNKVEVGDTGRYRTSKLNNWFLSSEPSIQSKDLRHHLDWILQQLDNVKIELLSLQKEDGITMNINCIWWSKYGEGGPTIWPNQMQQLADLNVECCFSFSYYGESEE